MTAHPYRILTPIAGPAFRNRCALTIMAKAPIPGKVKTRLSPPLTPHQAAALNACFLRDTFANLALACTHAAAEVVISYTPIGEEAAFLGILPENTYLLPQRGHSFGERLLSTAQDLFASGFSSVCLIDSDSPTVPPAEFVAAIEQLAAPGSRAVLGPSADGGYYLIGLQSAEPNLFDRITWSTDRVAAETIDRAAEINLPIHLLSEWYDVDDDHSLNRLLTEIDSPHQAGAYRAPHTRAYLHQLYRTTPRLEQLA